jgi:hypothetical protein
VTICASFRVDPSATVGRLVYELGNGQWDIPKLRDLLENVLPDDDAFDNYEVEHDFPDLGHRTAAKYGALSGPEGRVRVAWQLLEQDGGQRVVLTWEERGGPASRPPDCGGFGTRLIERVFTYELHGDAGIEFRPEGVRLEGSFPLSDRP